MSVEPLRRGRVAWAACVTVAACWTGGPDRDVAPTVDAGAPSGSFPSGPREEPLPSVAAPLCPAMASCPSAEHEDAGALRLLYEPPPSVELREVGRSVVVGFDRDARRFVVHVVSGRHGEVGVVALDPRFDRVRPAGASASAVLACAGAACEVQWLSPAPAPLPVPDELAATVADAECVAGTGIACWASAGTGRAWTTHLPAGSFPRGVEDMVHLGRHAFLVLEEGRPKLVHGGRVRDLDVGTSRRLHGLTGDEGGWWAALTEYAELVVGAYDVGTTCDLRAEAVALASGVGREMYLLQGASIRSPGQRCLVERLAPPGRYVGIGAAPCGISLNPFSVTTSGIYATTMECMLD